MFNRLDLFSLFWLDFFVSESLDLLLFSRILVQYLKVFLFCFFINFFITNLIKVDTVFSIWIYKFFESFEFCAIWGSLGTGLCISLMTFDFYYFLRTFVGFFYHVINVPLVLSLLISKEWSLVPSVFHHFIVEVSGPHPPWTSES